ncbi:MAG: DUF192 domain-containing protein [bacterium]
MATLLYKSQPLIPELTLAVTFWQRSIGLMGRPELKAGQGLLIRPCSSIHTCFMRFPIDLLFLDAGNRIIRITHKVNPWRLAWGGRKAHSVIEIQTGWLTTFPAIGDKVEII